MIKNYQALFQKYRQNSSLLIEKKLLNIRDYPLVLSPICALFHCCKNGNPNELQLLKIKIKENNSQN